jgi:hypothetical protein
MDIELLKYPIGRFQFGKKYSFAETNEAIEDIKRLPVKLERIMSLLTREQLDQSYRPGAWSARQLINHLGDVYINAYMRTKLLLTEDTPTIKPYNENAFALLPDSAYLINVSLIIISNLIERWVLILCTIPESDYRRKLYHPESKIYIPLDELVIMYAWHGNHHLAHLGIIQMQTKHIINR